MASTIAMQLLRVINDFPAAESSLLFLLVVLSEL